MTSCIEACIACRDACSACEEKCREMGHLEMAEVCEAAAVQCNRCIGTMREGSDAECGVCAFLCGECGEKCASVDEETHRLCAEACARCADECGKMAVASGAGQAMLF